MMIGVFLSDNFACCGIPALAVRRPARALKRWSMHNVGILSAGSELRLHRDAVLVVHD